MPLTATQREYHISRPTGRTHWFYGEIGYAVSVGRIMREGSGWRAFDPSGANMGKFQRQRDAADRLIDTYLALYPNRREALSIN